MKTKILIVEDDGTLGLHLERLMRKWGYETFTADSGETALKLAEDEQPDLALMDIHLDEDEEEMDGIDTAMELRTRFDIPSIYLTAYAGENFFHRARQTEPYGYLVKPLQERSLQSTLEMAVYMARINSERKLAEKKLMAHSEHLEEMVAARTAKLKKAQEELLAKERLAVLGHFAGSISHELRNPLAVIDSAVYLLRRKLGTDDEKVNRALGHITDNVRKSAAIIQSLLNLSRMEKPKAAALDLIDLVHESVQSSNIPGTVEVITHFHRNGVFVNAEREQIRMALKNLIRNAVQAMDESGTLTISVRPIETDHAEISIADTGPGISPEHIEKVFEPLFSTKTYGIGFGLSITKMIVENHGGTIRAASETEKGAVFTLTLPHGRKGENQ